MMSEQVLADADETIRRWFRDQLDARVLHLERQARWRPVWFASVEIDHVPRQLVVRGDRTDMPLIFPLDHEMRFQQTLARLGVPVAAVHGWIDELPAYVMERVPGEEHFGQTSDHDRSAAVDDYLKILSRLHQLPIAPFVEAGIERAANPSDAGILGLDRYEKHYRALKDHPDPMLEFFLGWLRRNPVDTLGREAPIVWDSGQFHHADGQINAVLDLELGHIGDPMMDLAAWRMRDTIVGYGDMASLYRRYEELSGAPVDLAAVKWHHLAFTLTNQLAFSAALAKPPVASDFMTNLQWCGETNLFATEALADMLGVALPEVPIPDARHSSAAEAHTHLIQRLRSVSTDDPFLRHETRSMFRLARHLHRCDEIGDAIEADDLDDIEGLVGARPANWAEGAARLERFVLDDRGAHDAELVQLFHRRNLRAHMLLGPAGSAMTHHHRIQPF